MSKAETAKVLRAMANQLEIDAHNERPMPAVWEIGQRVRFIRSQEWAFNKGDESNIVKLRDEDKGKTAREYQVFWTSPDSSQGIFWTTPDDVELVIDKEGE